MANKDYVKRGRSPRKTGNKTAKKKNGSQSTRVGSKPWKMGLIASLLITVFGYSLYFLNNPSTQEQPVEVEAIKPTKKNTAQEIPPLPEEQWSYMDELPNKEIIVEKKELKVSEIPYIMQCGAYKSRSQAEERKIEIAFQGLTSEVRNKTGSHWFRVVLGPYKFKREAERDRHKLQRAKIEPCAIWKAK